MLEAGVVGSDAGAGAAAAATAGNGSVCIVGVETTGVEAGAVVVPEVVAAGVELGVEEELVELELAFFPTLTSGALEPAVGSDEDD